MGLVSKFFAQFPMVGPHSDIEGELLLNGTKPLGWISILPDTADPNHPPFIKEREVQARLDAAVEEGRLSSKDVTYRLRGPDGKPGPREYVSRHYCQKGLEADLEKMVAFNQAAFNGQRTDAKLDKSFGDYLGYRQRDQEFFKFTQDMGRHLPRTLMDAINDFTQNVAKPAYQQEELKRKPAAPKI
jgi:hypothetical protein